MNDTNACDTNVCLTVYIICTDDLKAECDAYAAVALQDSSVMYEGNMTVCLVISVAANNWTGADQACIDGPDAGTYPLLVNGSLAYLNSAARTQHIAANNIIFVRFCRSAGYIVYHFRCGFLKRKKTFLIFFVGFSLFSHAMCPRVSAAPGRAVALFKSMKQ